MLAIEGVAVFILGLIVGSFLNVLSLRSGFAEGGRSRSACMACEAPLTWRDLVPVVSYLSLRGRCRFCGSRIALQYPLVEIGTACLFFLTFISAPALTSPFEYLAFAAFLVFWASFVVIMVVDLRHTLVPLAYAYALIVSALLVRFAEAFEIGRAVPLVDAALGAAALGGALALIVLFTRGRGMGAGDVYIAVAIGVLFGLARGAEVAALSFWIGAVVGIALILFKKGVRMKTELPFAPFLFVSSAVGAFTDFSPFLEVAALSEILFYGGTW